MCTYTKFLYYQDNLKWSNTTYVYLYLITSIIWILSIQRRFVVRDTIFQSAAQNINHCSFYHLVSKILIISLRPVKEMRISSFLIYNQGSNLTFIQSPMIYWKGKYKLYLLAYIIMHVAFVNCRNTPKSTMVIWIFRSSKSHYHILV